MVQTAYVPEAAAIDTSNTLPLPPTAAVGWHAQCLRLRVALVRRLINHAVGKACYVTKSQVVSERFLVR
jgi:hypothetical protein